MRIWAERCFCLRGASLKRSFGVLLTSRSRHQFLPPEALHGNVLGFPINNWKSWRKQPTSPGKRSTTPETSAEDDWAPVRGTTNTGQPPNVQPLISVPKSHLRTVMTVNPELAVPLDQSTAATGASAPVIWARSLRGCLQRRRGRPYSEKFTAHAHPAFRALLHLG